MRTLLLLPLCFAAACATRAARENLLAEPGRRPEAATEADSDGAVDAVDRYLETVASEDLEAFAPSTLAPLLVSLPDPEVELEPTRVVGRQDDTRPVGPYGQPEWTVKRRWLTTRAYVLPPGRVELEQWWTGEWPDEGGPGHEFKSEVSIGLPHRFQLDIYHVFEDPAGHGINFTGSQVELRYAFADWGEIPLNPTLYFEWKFNEDASDVWEAKILLADDIAPRWRAGSNIIFEREVDGEHETEMAVALAASYSLIESKLGIGAELVIERETEDSIHGSPEVEILLGPSIQWRITPRVHVDFVPLFGLTDDSPTLEAVLVFGISFGEVEDDEIGKSPTSLKSR